MGHIQEIEALQLFLVRSAGVPSIRLEAAPPTVTRPVVLWENPQRGRTKNITRYKYVVRVQQYGKLFVHGYDEAARIQEDLLTALELNYGLIPVQEESKPGSPIIATLKNVTIEFSASENTDIPLNITYEATYQRRKPEVAPPARYVGNRQYIKRAPDPTDTGEIHQ